MKDLQGLGVAPLLNVKQASAYLGISYKHLYKMTSRKLIPHIKLSQGILRFRLSDLEEYAGRNLVVTDIELEQRAKSFVASKGA